MLFDARSARRKVWTGSLAGGVLLLDPRGAKSNKTPGRGHSHGKKIADRRRLLIRLLENSYERRARRPESSFRFTFCLIRAESHASAW